MKGRFRKKAPKVEEISFDESARRDYLTGFHKRKVEEKKKRVEYAKKKVHEEKRESRRERLKKLNSVIPELEKIEKIAQRPDTCTNADIIHNATVKKIKSDLNTTTVTITEMS